MPAASSELIVKAIRLVYLFMRQKRVTVDDVAEELGVGTRNAHNWLLGASIVLPIYSPNEETRLQTERIVYELLDGALPFDLVEGSLTRRAQMGIRYFERRKAERRTKERMVSNV